MAEPRADDWCAHYICNWRRFETYLRERGLDSTLPIDPVYVAEYITSVSLPDDRPGRQRPARSLSTIAGRVGAIRAVHGLAGAADPAEDGRVREAVAQARDRLKNSRPNARAPLLFEDLKRIIGHIDSGSHMDRRDRALILLGVAGALAPRELEVLDVEDATFAADGLVVCIRQRADANEAVTLQAKSGRAFDAVGALREWLENAGLHGGPMFRQMNRYDNVQADRLNPAIITKIIKRRASAAGIPPERYCAQSLRSGGIRAAAEALHTERDLAAFSRIKTRCGLRSYTRLG